MAHDASHYLLTPEAVVTPRTAAEVAALLRVTAEQGVPLTFRAGGTSLSGQAGGGRGAGRRPPALPGIEVLDDGRGCGCSPVRWSGRSTPGSPATAASSDPTPRASPPARSAACRQQLLRDGLRHRAQLLRDPGLAVVVLPSGDRGRHRRSGRGRATGRGRAGAARRAAPAARPDPRRPGLGGGDPPALRHEEHHGLRAQLVPRPRRGPRDPRPT